MVVAVETEADVATDTVTVKNFHQFEIGLLVVLASAAAGAVHPPFGVLYFSLSRIKSSKFSIRRTLLPDIKPQQQNIV